MARGKRTEEDQMKLPALMHLARLGYAYLSPRGLPRDRETNILPGALARAVERINGAPLPAENLDRLMADLRTMAARDDLGEAFYRTLRDGWKGLRLIDFENPGRNDFRAIPELSCGSADASFRPDITLTVNGLPLALIEVKTRKQEKGIRAEYDRMRQRFCRAEFRPYLQEAQIWAFSNGREDDADRLLPDEGACFATAARGDFPLHRFRSLRPVLARSLPKRDRAEEARILADLGREDFPENPDNRARLSPDSPTHRMLTGLFAPEIFLLRLRYGIHYARKPGADGKEEKRKLLMNEESLRALTEARGKLRRGYRNWRLAGRGSAGENALICGIMEMIRQEMPGCRIYWVAANRKEMLAMADSLAALGMETGRRGRVRAEGPILMEPAEDAEAWLAGAEERDFKGRRVFFLPSPFPGDERMNRFRKRLRRADPGALMIRFARSAEPERTRNYTYLLCCADGTLYCGWTNDLERRVRTHNAGQGAKYTRSRRPVRLVYFEEHATREEAMRREWQLKQLTRARKEALIAAWQDPREEGTEKTDGTQNEGE